MRRNYEILNSRWEALIAKKLGTEIALNIENKYGAKTKGKNQGEKLHPQCKQATLDFLSDELELVKSRLEQKEAEMKIYRGKHMGSLPENLDANFSMLRILTTQLEQDNSQLIDAENRRAAIMRDAN